jgi:hypothetical protein
MTTQIVQIDRYRFICGLFWQSLSRRHELRAEAVALANKLNFDAMVLRIDRSFAGAGFASTREGAQFGLPSLGALVSKVIATEGAFYDGRQQPAPNWLGVFGLPDGRWVYFAVRDGAFLPNGDWVGSSEEVFERLHNDYSLGGWNVVIGDPEIEAQGFHNFYARKIEDMIPRRGGKLHVPGWLNLVPVSRRISKRTVVLAGVAAATVVVVVAGGFAYRQHLRTVERERALELARQVLISHQPKPVTTPQLVDAWAGVPQPTAFVNACLSQLFSIAPGGWQLDDYVCRPSSVSYAWSRNDSTVSMLLAAEPNAVLESNGDHATLVLPLTVPRGGDESIDHVYGVRIRMLSAFQLLGVRLTFALQVPPVPKPSTAETVAHLGTPPPPPPPPWRTWRLSANLGELSPRSLTTYLEQPGVRLDMLSYRAGQWTIEGVLYEK